jgi:hypothetical protein
VSQEIEQQIRERAYQLWVLNGHSHGRDQEHWCTAEREVIAATPVPAKNKKKSAAKVAAGAIASGQRRGKAAALHS